MNIDKLGPVPVPESVRAYAEAIKLDNYKTNSVKGFHRHFPESDDLDAMMIALARVAGVWDPAKLEPVFFSVCRGADTHTDDLPPEYADHTYVVPLVVPPGLAVLVVEDEPCLIRKDEVYRFRHTLPHSLTLENTTDGCAVLMVAERR